MGKVFSNSDLISWANPKLKQVLFSNLLSDPIAKQALQTGVRAKIIARSGVSFDAHIVLKGDDMYATLKGMPYGFQYKQKLIVAFIGKPSIIIQAKIKESYKNTLVLASSPVRFHERRSIEAPCIIYELPPLFADKFFSGEYILHRDNLHKTEEGTLCIWHDRILEKASQKILPIQDIEKQKNGKLVSLSRGGIGILRSPSENIEDFNPIKDPNLLKPKGPTKQNFSDDHLNHPTQIRNPSDHKLIYIQTTLRWGSNQLEIRCLAAIRERISKDGKETLNCCFLGDLPKLPRVLASGAKEIAISLERPGMITLNGESKFLNNQTHVSLPFGKHQVSIDSQMGTIRHALLNISPSEPSEIHLKNFQNN